MNKKYAVPAVAAVLFFAVVCVLLAISGVFSKPDSNEVVEVNAADIPQMDFVRSVQTGYSTNKNVFFRIDFSMPVTLDEIKNHLEISRPDGTGVKYDAEYCQDDSAGSNSVVVGTLDSVTESSLTLSFSKGIRSSEKISRPMPGPCTITQPVEKSFRFNNASPSCGTFTESSVKLDFTKAPEMVSLSEHLVFEPAVEFTLDNNQNSYWNSSSVTVSGEFISGRRYTMIIRKNLRSEDGDTTDDEVRRTFVVPDRGSRIEFAAPGRYLPPAGSRTVPVMAVNTERLVCRTARIPEQNIVQLLARDEKIYNSAFWWDDDSKADGPDTEELAGKPHVWTNRLSNVLNVPEKTSVPVLSSDYRGPVNGVFLMDIRDASDSNASARRLICITELGLSARIAAESASVWVTSLVTGEPLMFIKVRLYAANNTLIAEGMTDRRGIADLSLPPDHADPFVLTASTPDGLDFSFIQLTQSTRVSETLSEARREYLKPGECEAFVWSDRGIYRHNDEMMLHAIIRNSSGTAPAPFPCEIDMLDPSYNVYRTFTARPYEMGGIAVDGIRVPDDQPSGNWTFRVKIPGNGMVLGAHSVIVEEFVPPQIRVSVDAPDSECSFTNSVNFTVASEHLFGKPASGLNAEASFTYSDIAFKPEGFDGYAFGNPERKIAGNFKRLPRTVLDENGKAVFTLEPDIKQLPAAAVKIMLEGTVFETGGRPVSSRAALTAHKYPYYIGLKMPDNGRVAAGENSFASCAAVMPDGTRVANPVEASAVVERVSWVYGYKVDKHGFYSWRSEEIKTRVSSSEIVIPASEGAGRSEIPLEIPTGIAGTYLVTVSVPGTEISTSSKYVVTGKDDGLTADLSNPSKISMSFDKDAYNPGEMPKLLIRAPFTGTGWFTMQRDGILHSRTIQITNCTTEIGLPPVEPDWIPCADVALTLIRPAAAGKTWSAQRASGIASFGIIGPASELKVEMNPSVEIIPGGSRVTVPLKVSGGDGGPVRAAVTVVDEAINMLTGEKVPDPVGFFRTLRSSGISLYDIYRMLLPLSEDALSASGVKTGGDGVAAAKLMRRISPVASRRFNPLSRWVTSCIMTNGAGAVSIDLPEFAGEVRVTAVAYSASAAGAASRQLKVVPKIVLQPDTVRFLAPDDETFVTAALHNRGGADAVVKCSLKTSGSLVSGDDTKEASLKSGASTVISWKIKAGAKPGQGIAEITASGCGETHSQTIEIPVRPASAWRRVSDLTVLKPGEKKVYTPSGEYMRESIVRSITALPSMKAALIPALEYLVGYPYGCLEQTTSSVFPLIHSAGILGTLPLNETSLAYDAKRHLESGLARICSMQTPTGYSIWPGMSSLIDGDLSLYASHCIAEAAKAGYMIPDYAARKNTDLIRRFLSGNPDESVYACHILALAGKPDYNWMLRLYDNADKFGLSGRCHLARAFALSGDRPRAKALMKDVMSPDSIKTASLAILAMLEIYPDSKQIDRHVAYLMTKCKFDGHWGTTADNAHALLALGAYYRRLPETGPVTVSARTSADPEPPVQISGKKVAVFNGPLTVTVENTGTAPAYIMDTVEAVPRADAVSPSSNGISISRRFLDASGNETDMSKLKRGDAVIVELRIAGPATGETCDYEDLVIEELFPACMEFEPSLESDLVSLYPWIKRNAANWILRSEIRDDRIIFFSRAIGGGVSRIVYYTGRVVNSGEFTIPAPAVEAMYDPQIKANGASMRVSVAED